MQIQVLKATATQYPNQGRYFLAEMTAGAHSIIVSISRNEFRVIVQNASNRAWKGMGKAYRDQDAALRSYKTPEIRAMIEHAATLDKETLAQPYVAPRAAQDFDGTYL